MADAKGSSKYDAGKLAEDIVTCVMQRQFPEWVPREDYQKGMGFLQYETRVLNFCNTYQMALRNEWWQYFNGKEKSIENYEKYCSVIKSILANMSFSVGRFLVHLLKLAEFAALLHNTGSCAKAPSIAVVHIGEILSKCPAFLEADISDESCISDFHM